MQEHLLYENKNLELSPLCNIEKNMQVKTQDISDQQWKSNLRVFASVVDILF